MSLLLTAPATDRLPALNHGRPAACEYLDGRDRPCGVTAAWWVVRLHCGRAFAECVPHRIHEHQVFELGPHRTVSCRACDTRRPRPTWRALFRVDPIGARP